ncbi:MAG: ATP-binding protein [Spirochaetota bacterium]
MQDEHVMENNHTTGRESGGIDGRALMQTRLRHLENELRLLREEYREKARNYYQLYSRMEEKVEERTAELRNLQRALEIKNRQLEIIFDSSPVIIFYVNARGEYERVNRRFAAMVGRPVTDVVGKTPAELFPRQEAGPLGGDPGTLTGAGPACNMPARVSTPEGERELIVDLVPDLDERGVPRGLMGFATDVTGLKRAEAERGSLQKRVARAEKMEAIGLLAGGVAHDGNNILTGISGYLELLNMRIPEDDPNRRYIQGTLEATRKMGQLIDDLLTLTRSVVTRKKVLNLNEVVRDYLGSPMCRNLQSTHPEVRIEEQLQPGLLNMWGVSGHLVKMLMNLVTNAAEAMPKGGEISITTTNRVVDHPVEGYDRTIPEGRYVVLTVADQGTGIKDEDLGRVFEPFYTTKKSGRSGTGLGMALVYGIVKDHRGYLDLRSIPGRGTTFTIYFPVTGKQPEGEGSPLPEAQYLGSGQRVLVVDDVDAQRELLAEILARLGYQVEAVGSGEEAVEYLRDNRADLVVLDMIMDPGMDGLDTYRSISALRPGQRALIISGYARTERVSEAQRLGAGRFVKKPYTVETIGRAVYEELNR